MANVYDYGSAGAASDSGLQAPLNASNGCVRISNAAALVRKRLAPVGTAVRIIP